MDYHTFKEWMDAATTDEQKALAESVGVSRDYLYQLSGGFRKMSADMAGKVVDAAAVLRRKSKGRLPMLMRSGLCAACRRCPHANPRK